MENAERTFVNLTESMRSDWDQRARKNTFYYIASWRKDWTVESFLQSGEEDYERYVAPVFTRCGFEPQQKAMLELGCGAGRMTRSFAQQFARVYAVDFSDEMLSRARALLQQAGNVIWVCGNGTDLSGVESDSLDFVFSYLVLQHLPREPLVHQYIREMLRVLKEGGVFLFQFNGGRDPTMNWKGRWAWSLVDLLWALRCTWASQVTASWFGFDPELAGGSWRGALVEGRRVVATVEAAGGVLRELSGEHTPMAWCCGVKGTGA